MTQILELVVAFDLRGGIGHKGNLPWSFLSKDMRRFKNLTKGTTVIMGRKTWFSIPEKNRPLPNRQNIVLSRSCEIDEDMLVCKNFEEALKKSENTRICIIGGHSLYKEAILRKDCRSIHVTLVCKHFDCDVYFPTIDLKIWKNAKIEKEEENGTILLFSTYNKINSKV